MLILKNDILLLIAHFDFINSKKKSMKKGTQVLFVLFLSFFHVSIKGFYDKNLSPYILIITKFLMEAFSKTVSFCKKKESC